MASIPGAAFNITGASGSQAALVAKNGWRAYILPRGGHASQDSTGTLITFDSASVASRFAASNWIQAGLNTANIRLVAAVGGNSLSVSGAALTVSENDRIYLIGNTEPTVSGGSVTYGTPATLIRQRDDDGADLYTNSMITSNADGLIQFFAAPNYYDVLVQDGNRSLQGSIIDLPVGSVGGISTDVDALFGASVTLNGALGVTGWATFGSTTTFNAAIGVTGWATFGATVTGHANAGFTGTVTTGILSVGATASITGNLVVGSTGIVSGLSVATGILGVSNQPRCVLTNSSNISITSSSASVLTWNTETFDTGNLHASGATSSRISIPAGSQGVYHIFAQVRWATGNTGFREIQINRNGSVTVAQADASVFADAAGGHIQHACTIDNAASGDYYEVAVNQTSGTTATVTMSTLRSTSQFGAHKLA